MNNIVITIEDGVVRYLVSDATSPLLDEDSVVRRASHVEPVNKSMRILFHALRHVFGEKGRIASFTRLWSCKWRVNLSPSNGPILPDEWKDRQAAIDAEIVWLNENFL